MSEAMEIRAIRAGFLFWNSGVSGRPQSERAFMGEIYDSRGCRHVGLDEKHA